MADAKHGGYLGAVYDAAKPEEVAKLYDGWAETYDDYMATRGYRHPAVVLALLSRHLPRGATPLLDAGAGTGLVGEWIGIMGYPHIEALDLSPDRDLTITGSMAFAGGPYNNYFFQATARAAQLLRAGAGRTALLSCVSGILTKQAFALWSSQPPGADFVRRDVTAEVAATAAELPVVEDYTGGGMIAGYTVLHARGEQPQAVALIDTDDGDRALAVSDSIETIAGMERDEWVGRRAQVVAGQIVA